MPYIIFAIRRLVIAMPVPILIYAIGLIGFLIAFAIEGEAQPLAPIVVDEPPQSCYISIEVKSFDWNEYHQVVKENHNAELRKLCRDCGTTERKEQARRDYLRFVNKE